MARRTTRQTQFLVVSTFLISLYSALYLSLIPLPISQDIKDQIVPCLPFNLLITLGSYCLWELGMGVLTFGECDEAHDELMKEIEMAKSDLRSKGISVD
ncbi:dolichol-phosphate mannosyltransferase subunit 3 [Pseudohyphozyma bogoriensis]|nr:dolichol-phosphate mannosyltransferase subunit 3 [Pseudohyphozyma bogoriensis]